MQLNTINISFYLYELILKDKWQYSKDDSQIKPSKLKDGKKALVLIINNKNIINTNDEKEKYRKKKENHLYNQKSKKSYDN